MYEKIQAVILCRSERFYVSARELKDPGYLKVTGIPEKETAAAEDGKEGADAGAGEGREKLKKLRKGDVLTAESFGIKEGETTPPKRYTSGSMILAMENAGQLIEDDSLREQIRGSGIGTSATRADILAKLVKIRYLNLNKKTQVITPELLGEMVYDVVDQSIRSLLSPELTASWEKGLTGVAEGTVTTEEYMQKLEGFVSRRTNAVKTLRNQYAMRTFYDKAAAYYRKPSGKTGRKASSKTDQ